MTLEEALDRDDAVTYPSCVSGRGDAPVEDWIPESEVEPWLPFDRERINQELTRLEM